MDDSEDEDMRRAIALSLEESRNPTARGRQREGTAGREDDNDDGDEAEAEAEEDEEEGEDEEAQFQRDLQAAIEASKATASSRTRKRKEDAMGGAEQEVEEEEVLLLRRREQGEPVHRPAFLSERAKMERERLERLERLKRVNGTGTGTSTGNSGAPPMKRQRSSTSSPHTEVRTTSASQNTQQSSAATLSGKNIGNASASTSNINGKTNSAIFWDGELRQIANKLVDRDKDDRPVFRLSEIIGPKSEISLAILSSYSNSVDWLYGFFDMKTPIILVNQPGEDGKRGLKELAPNMLMTMPFIRNGRGCMHIKIMLIFYKDGRLRVVVPTANFVDYDWRDIENSAWVQDVPMREIAIRQDPKASDFPGTLQRVLHSLNVPAALTKFLDDDFPGLPIEALSELRMRWDWSKVKVKLVASIAGKHEGWDRVVQTGHPALMKAIQELDARPPEGKEVVLECQGSSIGMYSTQWMNEFYCSARGESAKIWLDKPRSQRAKLPWPPVKILFPSAQTVKDSVLGMPGGGTMFCRKAQWEAKNFPRGLFHDSNSKRGRVLMHSKMIVGTYRDKALSIGGRREAHEGEENLTVGEDDHEKTTGREKAAVVGWAYVGSHNFTPSAWGTLAGSAGIPSLNIVNYEMGVVLPLRTHAEVEAVACWQRPARKYVEGVDRAWMQEEMRDGMASRS